MTSQTLNILSVTIAGLSLIVSGISIFYNQRRTKAAELTLRLQIEQSERDIRKWFEDQTMIKTQTRQEFLRDLFNSFSTHNWSFIKYWSFPGVFPPLDDIKKLGQDKEKDVTKKIFGERVVALEHFNILLRVFTHKELLLKEDIEGFTNWANNWYEDSKQALKTILKNGDTYPLDFIKWLRDSVFFQQGDFKMLIGRGLNQRLRVYENFVTKGEEKND